VAPVLAFHVSVGVDETPFTLFPGEGVDGEAGNATIVVKDHIGDGVDPAALTADTLQWYDVPAASDPGE
jgi:hypothetical protein